MNKMNKKIVSLSLAMGLLLTACNAGGNASSGEVSSEAAVSEMSEKTTETAETSAEAKEQALVVYASTDPIYDFAQMIGGVRVQVVDLMEGEGDAHNWEPTPQLLADLSNADLFLLSGAKLEYWLDDVQNAISGDVQIKDMSEEVELIVNEEDHDHEHEEHEEGEHEEHEEHEENEDEHGHVHHHTGVDPHYWLNPKDAEIQAKNVYQALVEADPEGKTVYDEGYAKVQEEFAKLTKAYDEQLKPYAGRSVIVPHEAFAYLFNEYGLTQVGIEGVLAEGQPDAQQVAQIVDLAKQDNIQTVFYEGYGDPSQAEAIAKEIGANTAPLYTLEAESKEDRAKGANYFTFMMQNLDALVASFGD